MEKHEQRIERLPNFLNEEEVIDLASIYGTPLYVYDEVNMLASATDAKRFNNPFGLTVRYAMKANPRQEILELFREQGLSIDASSEYEVVEALEAGFEPENILLTSQDYPQLDILKYFVDRGVKYNACSLKQLRNFGEVLPNHEVGLRINTGLGSGSNNKTNVGGPTSPFGIWHEDLSSAKEILDDYGLIVERFHSHIGSGSDPEEWKKIAKMSIDLMQSNSEIFRKVKTINFGGGYKVGRLISESSTNLREISQPIAREVKKYFEETGMPLKMEIEPGTFLVANAGVILASVRDIKRTGREGFTHIILDSGMTENLRPSLYNAAHPISGVPIRDSGETDEVIVYGRACESGDLISPNPEGAPGELQTRKIKRVEIGDFAVIGGAGAYCESMSAVGYNSYPSAPALMKMAGGKIKHLKPRTIKERPVRHDL